ncbi:MAG TPA: hypothetical protein VLL47_09695, partial [Robiginitalea sp.]|nr:hypothetical protein [Robiginitalea sp.]
TDRSYRMSQFILGLLTFAALTIMINFGPALSKILFGLPIVVSGLLGILGTVYVIRGMHEPLSEKKVVAITVNLAMVVLMAAILISNTLHRL